MHLRAAAKKSRGNHRRCVTVIIDQMIMIGLTNDKHLVTYDICLEI